MSNIADILKDKNFVFNSVALLVYSAAHGSGNVKNVVHRAAQYAAEHTYYKNKKCHFKLFEKPLPHRHTFLHIFDAVNISRCRKRAARL